MKHRLFYGWIVLGLVFALAGCQPAAPPAAAPAYLLAVPPSMETLARGLLEGYRSVYPLDTSLQIAVSSSDAIRSDLDQGRISGALQWDLPAAEDWSAAIGWTGIVIIANSQNPVVDLSRKQARDIFTGAINRWEDVGGKTGDIHRVHYESGQDLASLFEGIVLESGRVANGFQAVPAPYAMLDEIRKDAFSIGYLPGFDFSHDVRALSIDHVTGEYANLISEKYPFRVRVYLVAKNPALGLIQRFAGWAQSVAGQTVFLSMQSLE